jgi:hypothetical protein
MTLLETYVTAQGKLDRDEHLTDTEAAIVLKVLQAQTGVIDSDSLTDDERECVVHASTTETRED